MNRVGLLRNIAAISQKVVDTAHLISGTKRRRQQLYSSSTVVTSAAESNDRSHHIMRDHSKHCLHQEGVDMIASSTNDQVQL